MHPNGGGLRLPHGERLGGGEAGALAPVALPETATAINCSEFQAASL